MSAGGTVLIETLTGGGGGGPSMPYGGFVWIGGVGVTVDPAAPGGAGVCVDRASGTAVVLVGIVSLEPHATAIIAVTATDHSTAEVSFVGRLLRRWDHRLRVNRMMAIRCASAGSDQVRD